MQELVLINKNSIIIQTLNDLIYEDSRKNFEADSGLKLDCESADYNRSVGSFWLNGVAFQKFPNEFYEGILNNVQTYIAAKEKRETTEPTFKELKTNKLKELDTKFLQWYEDDATVTSSLGFVADSDARAMMDVSGLVTTLEATPEEQRSTVAFMDHDNQPHMLTLEQMKTVQLEIIKNGQSSYAQKWAYRTAIEAAEDAEALAGIKIVFTGEDFRTNEATE